jgi:signal transduction histidine kinase
MMQAWAKRTEALFDDPNVDARMRRTIPEFAVLGAAIVAMSSPFLVPTTGRRLFTLGLAAIAVAIAAAIQWRGFVYRMTRPLLYALLVAYLILIALVVAASDDPSTPYRLLAAVPVTFTATFFTGWHRYSLAVLAPALNWVIAGWVMPMTAETAVGQAVMWLFLAHFGSVVSDTLRESLRTTRSLHTVLEASRGAPTMEVLAEIGLDAALSIVGWDAGAIILFDGNLLTIAATRGISATTVEAYRHEPRPVGGPGLLTEVVNAGGSVFVPDIRQRLAGDHPLFAEGKRAVAVVPLMHRDEMMGVLIATDSSVRRVDDALRERVEQVARQLGLALGSAASFRQEAAVTEGLRELNRRKDEFLANVSHELRTPAATIKLIASTLRWKGDRVTGAQLDEMYATLERRSSHLVELIEGLLDEAVAEAGGTRLTLTTIDWREAVVRWAEIAQLQSGRDVTLEMPAGAAIGTGDAVKLERVVANLLSNAAKFSPENTSITLALHPGPDWIEVEVTDRGSGIPPSELDLIFEPFHQVDSGATRATGGFGIGLSLVRHFVEAHGGVVSVRSTEGEGTTFTVRVPRTPPQIGATQHRFAERSG